MRMEENAWKCPFSLSGKAYKFISNMVASIRLWGVAGFHLLEALMSTRLVRSNRGMSTVSFLVGKTIDVAARPVGLVAASHVLARPERHNDILTSP